MNILHLHPEDYQTTRWSGGTTTQLFLYPQQSSYAARDFRFRVSSATVEQMDSDFTPLPGIERWITPVEGSFLLTHPDAPSKQMVPLSAPYQFWGQQPTHCHGKARDFNLMLQGCKGNMVICRESASVRPGFNGFYPTEDSVFQINSTCYSLKKGDFLVIFSKKTEILTFADLPVICCWAEI